MLIDNLFVRSKQSKKGTRNHPWLAISILKKILGHNYAREEYF